jgi:hypothetical protein
MKIVSLSNDVSIHYPAMNLALVHSSCLQKAYHSSDQKRGIIFGNTGHFLRVKLRHVMENKDTIYTNDIEMSLWSYATTLVHLISDRPSALLHPMSVSFHMLLNLLIIIILPVNAINTENFVK